MSSSKNLRKKNQQKIISESESDDMGDFIVGPK
jgi:hypothetical protein